MAKKQEFFRAEQQLFACITHFRTFPWRPPLLNYDITFPNVYRNTPVQQYNFFSVLFNLDAVPKNSTPRKFVNIMQIERDGIIAFKLERTQIQFFSVLLSFVWRQALFKTFLVLQ